MALIRVFGNTYLNPTIVGKVTLDVSFPTGKRIKTTKIYDLSGQVELAVFETTISVESDNPDKHAAARDNFYHGEVIRAIHSGCDAMNFAEPTA